MGKQIEIIENMTRLQGQFQDLNNTMSTLLSLLQNVAAEQVNLNKALLDRIGEVR